MECPSGYYCPDPTGYPIYCGSGKTSLYGSISSSNCYSCPTCSNTRKEIDCYSGYLKTEVYYCLLCPLGYYCPYANTVTALPCPAGTYS